MAPLDEGGLLGSEKGVVESEAATVETVEAGGRDAGSRRYPLMRSLMGSFYSTSMEKNTTKLKW